MNKSYSESSQFFQNIPKKIDTAHRTPTVNKPYKGNKFETKRNSRNNFRSIKSKGSNRVIDVSGVCSSSNYAILESQKET